MDCGKTAAGVAQFGVALDGTACRVHDALAGLPLARPRRANDPRRLVSRAEGEPPSSAWSRAFPWISRHLCFKRSSRLIRSSAAPEPSPQVGFQIQSCFSDESECPGPLSADSMAHHMSRTAAPA
jgi:hypothetical protein